MKREFELLVGLMAVQMRFVPGERFVRLASLADADPTKSLTQRLVEENVIGSVEMSSLRTIAEAQVRMHGGSEARALAAAPMDARLVDELLALNPAPALRDTLKAMRPMERLGTSILSKSALGLTSGPAIDSDSFPESLESPLEDLVSAKKDAKPIAVAPPVTPGAPSEVAQDVARAERALKAYVDAVEESRKGKAFQTKGLTRGVSEAEVTALQSDGKETRNVAAKLAEVLARSRQVLESLTQKWPTDRAIRRASAEFFARAAQQRDIEGNSGAAAELLEQSRKRQSTAPAARAHEGRLSVRTIAYECRCVLDARDHSAGTLVHRGISLLTGASSAALGKSPAQKMERLRLHGPECAATPRKGAQVWLFRYEMQGDYSNLVTPADVPSVRDVPLLESVKKALYRDHSPHAPEGNGAYLGLTPIEGVKLPPGSWVLVIALAGRVPLRVPVHSGLTGETAVEVTLPLPEEVPRGFCPVAEGPFTYQGDPKNPNSEPLQSPWTPGYFMASSPVTAEEYAEYLNDRLNTDMDFVVRRLSPRLDAQGGFLWPGPPFAVPTKEFLARGGEAGKGLKGLPGCDAAWNARWPVVSVSWRDAMEFCAWKRAKTGWLVTLPHEIEWEKAARGVDGRTFPWGNQHLRGACNTNSARKNGASPATLEEYPADESPYGVLGMGGNTRDICLNEPGAGFADQRVMRGGHWGSDGLRCHGSYRTCAPETHVSPNGGFRLMCLTRLGNPRK